MSKPPLCAAALPVTKAPKQALPIGSVDCHFHIFDTPSEIVPEASYHPPVASVSDYRNLQKTLGFERSVVIQPSIYGDDNRTTLSACDHDPNRKAVIVINNAITDDELHKLAQSDVTGCRVNMLFSSGVDNDDLLAFTHQIAEHGWHLQILADFSQLAEFERFIDQCPVPIMFDHMGHMALSSHTYQSDFSRFLKLLSDGKIWTKLSAPYRISTSQTQLYDDLASSVSQLVSANPEQLVWGTDWPHPQAGKVMPDDTLMLDQLMDWIPNSQDRQRIFASNPQIFYGF